MLDEGLTGEGADFVLGETNEPSSNHNLEGDGWVGDQHSAAGADDQVGSTRVDDVMQQAYGWCRHSEARCSPSRCGSQADIMIVRQ